MMTGTRRIEGLNLVPAVVIVCREFVISGLREFLAATGEELRVSYLAKWKTFTQITALAVLLAGSTPALILVGTLLLWIAALLALVTGVSYLKISWTYVKATQIRRR